jgi:hypothetical protein
MELPEDFERRVEVMGESWLIFAIDDGNVAIY